MPHDDDDDDDDDYSAQNNTLLCTIVTLLYYTSLCHLDCGLLSIEQSFVQSLSFPDSSCNDKLVFWSNVASPVSFLGGRKTAQNQDFGHVSLVSSPVVCNLVPRLFDDTSQQILND